MSKDTTQGTDPDPYAPEERSFPAVESTGQQTSSSQPPFDINVMIGWILQSGVLMSAAVVCIGLVLLFAHPEQLSSQHVFAFPHTPGEVKDGLFQLHPQAFIALGLLLLIATPVLRVAVSIFAFALEHDRRYVVITTVVLAILFISFLLGKGGG